MGDAMLLGLQQMIDAERAGQTWLNSVPVVDGLLDDLQRVAWNARLAEAKGEIDQGKRCYLVSAKVSELTQIFEGRHPGYAALPWNEDPRQMKAHLVKVYWEAADDAPGLDEVLSCTLDDCSAAAVFGVEALLPDCPPMLRQIKEQVLSDLVEARHRAGACLMGVPIEIFASIAEGDQN